MIRKNTFFALKNIVTLLLVLLTISCRDIVQDEFPDFRETPVINAFLVSDSIISVHLSFTGKIDNDKLQVIENANIDLFKNNTFIGKLEYDSGGVYISDAVAEAGNDYRIEVHVPGFDRVTARDIIPEPDEIINITHVKKAGKDEEGHFYPAVKLTFTNNQVGVCYYEIVINYIDYGRQYPAELIEISDPVLLNEGIPLALFSNKLIPDGIYEMTLNYTTGSSGFDGMNLYPLVIEFRTVSYDYYRYKQMLYLYELGRYPDNILSTTSVTTPYSNASGGYGIFAGYSVFRSDTILP